MNKLLVFVSSIYLVLAPTYTYATPPKWVQDYIKTEQYNQQLKEKAKVTSSNGNITSSVSNSGTSSAGTAVKTTAVLTKKASSGSVAAQIAKRYGKAIGVSAAGAFLGSAALQLLIEGIGWVMGEGGKINKIQTVDICKQDGTDCTYAQNIWYNSFGDKYFPSAELSCKDFIKRASSNWTYSRTVLISDQSAWCYYTSNSEESRLNAAYSDKNSNYNPNAQQPSSTAPVTTTELEQAVKSYIDSNPNSQIANDLNAAAYSYDAANDDSSSLASENANAMQSSLNNAATSPSGTFSNTSTDKAGNPQNVTSTVKSGAEATGEATTTNPDGSQSGSSMSMQFPAFCEWASIVCDFIDWYKEEPDLQDESLAIDEEDITAYKREDYIVFGQTCPFEPKAYSLPLGIAGSIDFEADASIFCTYGYQARPFIQGLGYLGGLIFLLYFLRSGNA
ncbi:hypothetical protein ACNJ69_03500 [Acinetobacter soli]|uniref:hypothetical protein n=1 Tax=Acinetobacter soli TaxID=487316 RepID=UPI001F20DA12|nr:hypothetical protein [Acinetobacter soli]MCE6006668.1 hypothetical protein [Acinetobacter soli]